MQKRVLAAALIIGSTIAGLVAAAVSTSAVPIETVDQLLHPAAGSALPSAGKGIRIGARVAEGQIDYTTSPTPPRFKLAFKVRDIVVPASQINVVYYGIMPDTLKAGRDVILEGSYDGSTFAATDIKTQCPSKYEPPVPGAKDASAGYPESK